MSTWDVEPFDNDDAADFAIELDDASTEARIEMVGSVLERVAKATADDPLFSDAQRAVAAAALIAAQHPGGANVPSTYGPGPTTPMPQFPAYLRDLAIETLDRVITAPSWLPEYWEEAGQEPAWRRSIFDLRGILNPPQQESLFDL
ncbi:DUF4259 domain-containing protein [Actinoplanes hulinensis]|uniref:DUF4259 domain-containing protein n=1 Tax=Actinoplanes hulinensis TaxID=1144547 RepID=A0ABS7B477_9ACTN|nr:DUF4259 domain-containing protein [Actinoplanes hulinensis]MBW6435842.1 DUF4259 domain-containing protein [Actinoplanes hulinensis]